MVKHMVRGGGVMAIVLAAIAGGGGCVFGEGDDDLNGGAADVLTPGDLPDVGGGIDVVASEIEPADVVTQDGAESDVALPDIAPAEITTLDAPDQDSAGADNAVEDAGCDPSCNGLECGPDPVCGVLDCGSCPDGLGCVAGKCGVVGCYSALEYICDEAYAVQDGATLDLGAIRDECIARGASWQACPTGDRVLTVEISRADGSSMVRSYYLGLYCGAGDAMGIAAFEFGASSLDPQYMNTPSGCSTEMIDAVGCLKGKSTMAWYVEMARGRASRQGGRFQHVVH